MQRPGSRQYLRTFAGKEMNEMSEFPRMFEEINISD